MDTIPAHWRRAVEITFFGIDTTCFTCLASEFVQLTITAFGKGTVGITSLRATLIITLFAWIENAVATFFKEAKHTATISVDHIAIVTLLPNLWLDDIVAAKWKGISVIAASCKNERCSHHREFN